MRLSFTNSYSFSPRKVEKACSWHLLQHLNTLLWLLVAMSVEFYSLISSLKMVQKDLTTYGLQ